MRQKQILLLSLLLFGTMAAANAQRTVTGRVTDSNDGRSIPMVSVIVKGTNVGVISGSDGSYSVEVPAGSDVLTFSFIGYTALEESIGDRTVVNVSLEEATQELDDIIVVAYGTAKKSSVTGSVTTIKSETLEKRKVSNVSKALDGLAPGVQVTSGSGQPGSGSSVYIRGLGSINASNTPLYVVDGIPYDGNISAISSNDIETMTLLKDASAGALYGARGANGVVMITTKKGKSGRVEVNFKANFGIASRAIPRYETMKSKDFVEALFSGFYNQRISEGAHPDQAGAEALYEMAKGSQKVFGTNEMYNPYDLDIAELIDPATGKVRDNAKLLWEDDWLNEVTRNDAWRKEYTLDVSGGSDKTQYFVAFGYLDHDGILATTNFKRYSGRTNVEAKPLDWFRAGLNSNFSRTESNYLGLSGSSTSNVWSSAQMMGPVFPVYLRDRKKNGDFVLNEFGAKQFDYGPSRPAASQGDFNSIATLYDDLFNQKVNNLSARGHVDFGDAKEGWSKGLKLSLSLGMDYYGLSGLVYYNPYFGNAKNSKGRVTKSASTVFSYTANQMLSYNTTIEDKHHIDAMVAHEYYDLLIDGVSAAKTSFPFGGVYQPDAAATLTDGSGAEDKYRIESYLGRVNYDYDDKYFFSASLRTDASSRFHADNRRGVFWSVGANYRISKEQFMESTSSWLDNLALKASYGHQGNDNISGSYYVWQALYDLGWSNGNEAGALVNAIENPKVSWEKNANFNVGLDISTFDSRLQATLEYYSRKTADLLLNYPMPLSTGFSGYSRNSGSMLNSGFELTLSGKIIKTNDLEWSATLMAATLKNKVLKLTDEGKDITSSTRIIREGEPYQSWYLAKSAGVDPMTGDQLFWATVDSNGKDVTPYVTNSVTLANSSRQIVGHMFPDLFGSLSTTVKYKSFDLSVAAGYSLGGKMIDGVYQQMMSFYYPAQAKHVDLKRAWKKPGDVTDIPRYNMGNSITYTENMLIDASYFSLKNITLGYTLASRVAEKIKLKSLRLYATVDNLHLFTSLKGTNPQYSITGGTDFTYVPERLVSFGIDLKF